MESLGGSFLAASLSPSRGNFSAKQDTQSDPAYIAPVYFFILAKQSIGIFIRAGREGRSPFSEIVLKRLGKLIFEYSWFA